MGACLRKPSAEPVVIEPEDAPAAALAADDLTKPPNALHVRIIRARNLPAVDTNLLSKNSSDPYVLLECCGERARTTTKKKNLNPDYGEAFLLSRDEDEPLTLVVMDADVLSSDDVMCSCVVPIVGREPRKAWYDLTDQKGSRRANELCVVLRRAKDLRVADHSIIGQGSSDPFVVIRCDGASVQSRVVSKNLNPVFDELLSLRVEDDTAPIRIEVRDKDMVGSDLLGKVELGAVGSLDAAEDAWYQLDQQGALRLSLRWRFSEEREPCWIEREEKRDRSTKLNELAVFLRGASGSAIGDPRSNKGVFAVLKCDGASGRTSGKTWDNEGRWNEEVCLQVEDDHAELLIEVRDKGVLGSSLLGSLVLEHSVEAGVEIKCRAPHAIDATLSPWPRRLDANLTHWLITTQAEAITFGERVLENESIRVQLCVSWRHNPELVYDIEEDATIESWSDAQEQNPPNVLHVRIIRAKEVKAMDWALLSTPKSDPVCRLTLGDQTQSTKVVRSSVNPVWDESFLFNCHKASDMLELLVQDEDRFLLGAVKSHDFIGKVQIRIGELRRGPHRTWFELRAKDKGGVMSKLAGDLNVCERGLVEVFLDWKFDPSRPADGYFEAPRPVVEQVATKKPSKRILSKPTEADFKLGKQSVFQVASLRGVPNRLEVVVVRAEIMADPEDLKAYEGASRDAYCRLSAGEERLLAPSEPGAKRQKTFVLTGDVWQSETIKRSLTPSWNEDASLQLDSSPKAALQVQVYDDTCASNDEDDYLVGSSSILLKDLLGVAKDGLDYVETWVALKSPAAGAKKGWGHVDDQLEVVAAFKGSSDAAPEASPDKSPQKKKTPVRRKKKHPALHVLTSGLVVTKRRAKKLNHAPFSASHPADEMKAKSPGNLARDIAKAKVKAVSPMLKRLKAARVAASPKSSFDRGSRVAFSEEPAAATEAPSAAESPQRDEVLTRRPFVFDVDVLSTPSPRRIDNTQAIANDKKLRKTGNKVIAVNRLAEKPSGDGRVLLQLKWVFDPRLNPREMGLDEEAEWARRLGVSGEPPTGKDAMLRRKALASQAPPNALHITVVRATRVRAPPSLAKEGGFTLLAEVRVAHRLFLTTDTVSASGGSRPDEAAEVVWKAKGRKQIREREISPKATLEIAILAVDKKGEKHVVGKSVVRIAQYRDGYPRRAWLKLGERATGQVDSWRGAVDVFVVWAHEDNEAWDAERQQVKAKEAAKQWREANVEDRSHITSALSLLEDSIKTLERPAQKAKLRISTESVAEELFDDASHATTHTYLPDGLPVLTDV